MASKNGGGFQFFHYVSPARNAFAVLNTMNVKAARLLAVLLLIYAFPVVIYIVVFGSQLSTSHVRWAEFGSAMSGIYAPIVAVSTLLILYVQVGLQRQINEHQYVQSHLQQARSDLEFYSVQLVSALEAHLLPGQTVRQVLHTNFGPHDAGALDQEYMRELAANIDANAPSSLALWFAVYPILAGLEAGKGSQFEMTLSSSISKLIAMLSFETCVALDNYHRTRTKGRISVRYKFSPLLSKSGA